MTMKAQQQVLFSGYHQVQLNLKMAKIKMKNFTWTNQDGTPVN